MIWWCWTILALTARGRVVHISFQFTCFDWMDIRCEMSIYKSKAEAVRFWEVRSCVWANWTNPRNWANSPAIHGNYSVGTARHSQQGNSEWFFVRSVKLIFMKIKNGWISSWIWEPIIESGTNWIGVEIVFWSNLKHWKVNHKKLTWNILNLKSFGCSWNIGGIKSNLELP